MTEITRYFAEEIALDHADGLITRREALRRLGLLGLGLVASSSLLAACAKDPTVTATSSPTAPTTPPAQGAQTSEITFDGPGDRTLIGAFAAAETQQRAVLVIHENRGLTDHIRSVAGRLAADGYTALAIDLLSEEGGTASLGDSANATAALSRVPEERFAVDMKAGLSELETRAPDAKLGAMGFCFGGGMVWTLLASGEPRLSAAVPFYGPLPEGADFSGSPNAAVLAIYAELDSRVNESRDAARSAMAEAGLTNEVRTFPGADHAFFNDTGDRYNADAASDAYRAVQNWFAEHLGQ